MAVKTPNVYSCSPILGAGSTVGASLSFDFGASWVRVYNPSAVDLYMDLDGDVPSTCVSHVLVGCSAMVYGQGPRLRELGLHTTSTAAGGIKVHVLATGE